MHHALPAIDADMRLHTEVPLLAFPGLVHLRVALAALVPGRRGRMNNRCVYDRSGSDADALAGQMVVHRIQHSSAQIVRLQQMAEPADAGLVRRRCTTKINAHKAPQPSRIIERLFYTWVRQVKPLLHEVSPQHDPQTHRTAAPYPPSGNAVPPTTPDQT